MFSSIGNPRCWQQRIEERCDDPTNALMETGKFEERLRRNGFDKTTIREMKKKIRGGRPKEEGGNLIFFVAPFVSDEMDGKLRKLFQRLGRPVIISHRGTTFRNALGVGSYLRDPNATPRSVRVRRSYATARTWCTR